MDGLVPELPWVKLSSSKTEEVMLLEDGAERDLRNLVEEKTRFLMVALFNLLSLWIRMR